MLSDHKKTVLLLPCARADEVREAIKMRTCVCNGCQPQWGLEHHRPTQPTAARCVATLSEPSTRTIGAGNTWTAQRTKHRRVARSRKQIRRTQMWRMAFSL